MSQEGYSPFGRDCEAYAYDVYAPTPPFVGFSPSETQKSSPYRKAFSVTSQEGYSPFGRDCEAYAYDVYAPTPPFVGFSPSETQKSSPYRKAFSVTSQEGFEPPTDALEGRCSIQLSY